MKRIIALLVFGILLFGCAQEGEPSGTSGAGGTTAGGSGGQIVDVGGTTGGASTPPASAGGSGGGIVTIEQPEPGAGDAVVYMRNNRFEPEVVTVKQGNAVFWYNEDETPHNVRMIGVIDSPYLVKDGGPYWHTFEEYPGEYEYYCEIHQSMRGRVIVTR